MNFLSRFLTVSSIDPDDTRRRRILNILLAGLGAVSLFALIIFLAMIFFKLTTWENSSLLVIGSMITVVGMLIIYLINIFWSGRVAAIFFLGFLTFVFAFSDTPEQVSGGRSLFVFAIPIIMASILLAPLSSFVFSASVALLFLSLLYQWIVYLIYLRYLAFS